jgi:hypothetical protein
MVHEYYAVYSPSSEDVFNGKGFLPKDVDKNQIAELFGRERSVISKHIKKIFIDLECDIKSNVQKMHIANSDKLVEFYSLDVIISVGYRVKSIRGVVFRKWATKEIGG